MFKGEAISNIRANFRGPIDVTLREGEQFGGRLIRGNQGEYFDNFEFSFLQAKSILRQLHGMGIEYAEVPNGLVKGINPIIAELVALSDRPKLLCHIRNNLHDINAAVDLGVDGVNILTTVEQERVAEAGFEYYGDYLNELKRVVRTAQEHNLQTRISVEHAWNVSFDRALQVFEFADHLGVDRIGLPDTIGVANRFDVEDRITQAKKRAPRSGIEVHFHNDGGLAIANSIEALIHGANYVDTSAAGIGERNGITSISGLLTQLYMMDSILVEKFHLELLTPLEQDVMKMVGLPVPHNLNTSDNAFTHKAGIHTRTIRTHSAGLKAYQPFAASTVGNVSRVITDSRISGSSTAAQIRAVIPNVIVQ